MTKKRYSLTILVSLFLCLFFAVTAATAEDNGKKIFTEMKCSRCHAPQEDQKGAPSLQRIASVYGFGGENTLFQYFLDAAEPIVAPERAQTMKSKRLSIQKLTKTEQEALANYIMEFL